MHHTQTCSFLPPPASLQPPPQKQPPQSSPGPMLCFLKQGLVVLPGRGSARGAYL